VKPVAERIAEIFFGLWIVGGAIYLLGHVVAAWLRGSFQVVTR
jgi:hypothetical protein